MKGVSLPINIIVIIVIAMIVLLAIIALFMGVWEPDTLIVEAAKNNACNVLVSTGCDDTTKVYITNFDVDGDTEMGVDDLGAPVDTDDNLQTLCEKYYSVGYGNDIECRTTVCRCR